MSNLFDIILESVSAFFIVMLGALTLQNVVFARAFGVSRLMSLLDDTTDTVIFGALLSIVMTLGGVLFYFANRALRYSISYYSYIRPLVMVLCMGVAFFIVFVLTVKFAPYEYLAKAVSSLPVATFNCTVVGTLITSVSGALNYSLASVIAFSLGSSVGFMLAVLLATEGQRRLQNRDMPSAFKGLPATLLFLGGLALAVYGLAGYQLPF
jgi:Na+-translocating ferredoxin:NAD+ oxidoreductase RnfA subunit